MSPTVQALVYASVIARFVSYSERYEGRISWMYRCVANKVTIGAGCILEPMTLAFSLPLRWADGRLATREEIIAEWQAIKTAPDLGDLGAAEAKKIAQLHLSSDALDALTWQRFDAVVKDLAHRFPAFVVWPAAAQLATIGMTWALGSERLWKLFVRWRAHVDRQDWAAAAGECKIDETDNDGVIKRNRANRALFEHAAALIASGGDPAELPDWVGHNEGPPDTVPAPAPTEPQGAIPGAAEAHASAQLLDRELLGELARDGWRERDDDKGLLIRAGAVNLPSPMADEQHPHLEPILKFFEYKHLPPHLQEFSRPWCELAERLVATLPRNAERTVALRKLLEGKDAAVRAALP